MKSPERSEMSASMSQELSERFQYLRFQLFVAVAAKKCIDSLQSRSFQIQFVAVAARGATSRYNVVAYRSLGW